MQTELSQNLTSPPPQKKSPKQIQSMNNSRLKEIRFSQVLSLLYLLCSGAGVETRSDCSHVLATRLSGLIWIFFFFFLQLTILGYTITLG